MNEIIIDVGMRQNKVAVLENHDLVELYHEREENKRTLGNIYKGRVVNVLPGMEAAFVNIGLEKNAFLYVKDAIPKEMLGRKSIDLKSISIKDVVKQGQEIIVQVTKEPYGTKGARITTHITLPGRFTVLMPYTNYIGISRRISSDAERERLKGIAEKIKPEGMGLILRTVAEGKSEDEFIEDIEFLSKIYDKIDRERNLGNAPRIVYRDMDLVHRTVRDLFTIETKRLVVNDWDTYNSLGDLLEASSPHLRDRLEFFDNTHDLFGHLGIESMIKKALQRKVWLRSGGYIIIDETEALTVVDINTGKYVGSVDLEHTVVKTNIEAANEIAKQLRLRNIGGIIIIDFIDMTKNADTKIVLATLEKALKKDRTRTTVLGMTQLGLVEMTRKKNRKRLSSRVLKECPYCEGEGRVLSHHTLLDKVEKEVRRTKLHTTSKSVLIEVHPSLAAYIKDTAKTFIKDLEKIYDITIHISGDDQVHYNEIKVKKGVQIKMNS